MSKNGSSNFHLAFYVLPKERRKAMFDFYGFCRAADDIVDEIHAPEKAKEALLHLREEVQRGFHGEPTTELGRSIQRLRQFPVQEQNFVDILDGCEMDLTQNRYATFEDLYGYCYRVASAVGLVCKEIFGAQGEGSREFAIFLGVAFQLTNILRDIREDALLGRIYLPLEDLRKFGYSEDMLLRQVNNVSFRELMFFEGKRAEAFYRKAYAALTPADRRAFLPALLMAAVYSRILRRIERNPNRVLSERIEIPKIQRMAFVLGAYLHERFGT